MFAFYFMIMLNVIGLINLQYNWYFWFRSAGLVKNKLTIIINGLPIFAFKHFMNEHYLHIIDLRSWISVKLRSIKRLSNTNRTEICVIFVSPSSWYVFYNIIVRKTKGELFDYLRGYICYSDKKIERRGERSKNVSEE